MARPLRIEFAGALYHVTSRGNGRQNIYLNDADRERWLSVFAEVCHRFNWVCYSYCLMGNHYHLFIETPEGNLSQGMRHLNGVYTQDFNRFHRRVGHLYQGRYTAILVQKEAYLLELTRYIVLNPVRARMVRTAQEWPWSSYQATIGLAPVEDCLNTAWVLSAFNAKKSRAIRQFIDFVSRGKGQPSVWHALKNQIYLGDEQFVEDMQCKISGDINLDEVPRPQKRQIPKPIEAYKNMMGSRNEAIISVYQSGGYSMSEIGEYFGLHYSSVSKIIKMAGDSQFKT
ncbi:MAG: transposase [Gammaproteobacteria bacterium]|nr:transposase [Gammaproteobacteria bacterium]